MRERLSYEPQAVVRIVRIVQENNADRDEWTAGVVRRPMCRNCRYDVESGDHSCFPDFESRAESSRR